jgi:hypothetical protein
MMYLRRGGGPVLEHGPRSRVLTLVSNNALRVLREAYLHMRCEPRELTRLIHVLES